ncbi:uncharacterized protein [Hetaerina americana]|uniref:uncharacterized protein isoform X2 n=1 Tax=Hetaerina americana TaxID=62018 RepID=UPI003A7F5216
MLRNRNYQNELIGYMLMLAVMRFNVAIALAVWFGAGLGYFVFAANISTSLSSRNNGQRSRGRSKRSVTPPPHQDFDSTTEKLSEENAGDENEEGWKAEASQQPFQHGLDHSVTEPCDHLPDNDGNQDGFVTATVIVHREPSSQK